MFHPIQQKLEIITTPTISTWAGSLISGFYDPRWVGQDLRSSAPLEKRHCVADVFPDCFLILQFLSHAKMDKGRAPTATQKR